MGYPLVTIHNSTSYVVRGKVEYMSIFCSDDKFEIDPGGVWTATSRGVCLLTEITVKVDTKKGAIKGTPYKSSGTSYSQFAIIKQGEKYAVTRIVNLKDDVGEIKYDEPTEQQK